MIVLTESLKQWLFRFHRDLVVPLLFGHVDLFTDEMWEEYIEWCKTDEGTQYLDGGAKYRPPK